jgi:hypothetical protein
LEGCSGGVSRPSRGAHFGGNQPWKCSARLPPGGLAARSRMLCGTADRTPAHRFHAIDARPRPLPGNRKISSKTVVRRRERACGDRVGVVCRRVGGGRAQQAGVCGMAPRWEACWAFPSMISAEMSVSRRTRDAVRTPLQTDLQNAPPKVWQSASKLAFHGGRFALIWMPASAGHLLRFAPAKFGQRKRGQFSRD